MGLGEIEQPSTTYLAFRKCLKKKWENNNDVCQLFIAFQKAYDSIKRESLYYILIKLGICLDGTQSKVRIETICQIVFPLRTV